MSIISSSSSRSSNGSNRGGGGGGGRSSGGSNLDLVSSNGSDDGSLVLRCIPLLLSASSHRTLRPQRFSGPL